MITIDVSKGKERGLELHRVIEEMVASQQMPEVHSAPIQLPSRLIMTRRQFNSLKNLDWMQSMDDEKKVYKKDWYIYMTSQNAMEVKLK